MKTIERIFLSSMALLAMTACNNELNEQLASNNGGDVKFTMGIEGTSASRVAMEDGSYQATFENGNKVGIFVKDVTSYSNLEYTYSGNAWTGAAVSVPADGVYTYSAYYPYTDGATATAIITEVQADQETSGYLANDFLMSSLTATAGQTNVGLQFTHALSLVEVTLSGPNAAEDATVTLSNMTTDATINLEASTVTPGQTKGNVTMDNLTTAMKYRAIVPEQTVTKGTALMTIASKGRTYKVSYKESDVKFEKGKYISLNVELGSSSAEDYTVTITSQGITNWGTSAENPGSATVEEVPLISKFEETDFISANSGTLEPVGSSSTWFYILGASAGSESKCEIKDVETAGSLVPEWKKQADVTFVSTYVDEATAATANNWWTAALGYFYKGEIYTENTFTYKLSFKAKGKISVGSEPEEAIQLYVICRNSTNDVCFGIINNTGTPTSTYSTKNLTQDWAEYSFYIHFDKKYDGNPKYNVGEFASTSLVDYQNIHIRICTNGNAASADATPKITTLSVTDVTLEPYIVE